MSKDKMKTRILTTHSGKNMLIRDSDRLRITVDNPSDPIEAQEQTVELNDQEFESALEDAKTKRLVADKMTGKVQVVEKNQDTMINEKTTPKLDRGLKSND